MLARIAVVFGGRSVKTILPSAATLVVPDNAGIVYVTGSTTITSLLPSDRGGVQRAVLFKGAAGCNVTFTNTNTTTAAGQMYLKGSDRTIQEGDALALFYESDGTWSLLFAP